MKYRFEICNTGSAYRKETRCNCRNCRVQNKQMLCGRESVKEPLVDASMPIARINNYV